jgi:hypothetical protein
MHNLDHFEKAFQSVGWFIPPYAQMGYISQLVAKILNHPQPLTPDELSVELSPLYSAHNLAAMVCSRYPIVPILSEYKQTIGESIEAHFLGLHHVAATGLVPVVEGAGRRLLESRVAQPVAQNQSIKDVIVELATYCKMQSRMGQAGHAGEVESMMNSFAWFAKNVLFADSATHGFIDNTNRHGMAHGFYRDSDYGKPINFYKIIAAVEFLAFVSSFTANVSWFAPDLTDQSFQLAKHYIKLEKIQHERTRT